MSRPSAIRAGRQGDFKWGYQTTPNDGWDYDGVNEVVSFDLNGSKAVATADRQPIGPGTGQTTLDAWYRDYVIGGPGAFLLAAQGFEDFGRAFRQKFVTEVSCLK